MFIQLNSLPRTADAFQQQLQISQKSPYGTTALLLAALHLYPDDNELALSIIDALKGGHGLSDEERAFIRLSLTGSEYLPDSYWDGATPTNNYTPRIPYTLSFTDTLEMDAPGRLSIFLISNGAKDPREVVLKEAAGRWFLADWTNVLLEVRPPASGKRASKS
ncbi:MAG: hypothetical protein Q4P30_04055 [Eubacteriales bacterium]|nr:hypothetical protein [Eubacteriales bacterium]